MVRVLGLIEKPDENSARSRHCEDEQTNIPLVFREGLVSDDSKSGELPVQQSPIDLRKTGRGFAIVFKLSVRFIPDFLLF